MANTFLIHTLLMYFPVHCFASMMGLKGIWKNYKMKNVYSENTKDIRTSQAFQLFLNEDLCEL